MLKRINIGKRPMLSFGLAGAAMAMAALMVLFSYRNLNTAMKNAEIQTQNSTLAHSAQTSLLKTVVYLGSVITTPRSLLQESYLNTISSNRSDYLASFARLQKTLKPEAQPLLAELVGKGGLDRYRKVTVPPAPAPEPG